MYHMVQYKFTSLVNMLEYYKNGNINNREFEYWLVCYWGQI